MAARSSVVRRSAKGRRRTHARAARDPRRDGAARAASPRGRLGRGIPAPRPARRPCGGAPRPGPRLRPWQLEPAQGLERAVVRQIGVYGPPRDDPLARGMEIRALGVLALELLASDPVVLLATRVDLLDDRVAVAPPAHARQRDAPRPAVRGAV